MRSISVKFAALGTGTSLLVTAASAVLVAQSSNSHRGAGSLIAPLASRIKVGVLLSEFTAEGWHGTGSNWDLSHQRTIMMLRSSRLELYVIYEPGPQKIMAAVGRRFFGPDHMLNSADLNAL